jgi:hypothetical protein
MSDTRRNDISNRTIEEIQNEINSHDEIENELINVNIEELFELYSKLITGHSRTIYNIEVTGVFRARIHDNNNEFETLGEIWYPDWANIEKKYHDFGRCNNIGESMFYCSTSIDTCITELRPKLGKYVTIVEYNSRLGLDKVASVMSVIGVKTMQQMGNDYSKILSDYYNRITEFNGNLEKQLLIDNYLSEKFKIIVDKKEAWRYKPTISISKILLHGNHHGIVYPSVASNFKGVNHVYKPEFVDSNFKVRASSVCKVIEANMEGVTLETVKVSAGISVPAFFDENYRKLKISWRLPQSFEAKTYKVKY